MARKDGGYRLPSELNPARKCIMLEIPKNREHMIAFTGALQELTKWWNWERDDNKTGLAAALVWQDVLSQLVGQIDYADPEIWEGCTLPPNFRLTESCELQYTNDDGETWTTVSGWPEFSECFTGPEGPEGPEGPAGPAGPAGPTGPTGVVTAQLVRVDGDTPPDFYYTPATQTLTAIMQEQWLRGIRAQPTTLPANHYIPPHLLQVQTYDGQPNWVTLATIPPYGKEFHPPPSSTPEVPMDDECKILLATMNAEEVMQRTYTEVSTSLAIESVDDPIELLELIVETVFGLIVGDEVRGAIFVEILTALAFIGQQAAFAGEPFPSGDRQTLRDIFADNATVDAAGNVIFDTPAIRSEVGALFSANPSDGHWGLINYLLFFLGDDALTIAGAVGYYTDASNLCADIPDFTVTIGQAGQNLTYLGDNWWQVTSSHYTGNQKIQVDFKRTDNINQYVRAQVLEFEFVSGPYTSINDFTRFAYFRWSNGPCGVNQEGRGSWQDPARTLPMPPGTGIFLGDMPSQYTIKIKVGCA